MSEDSYEKTSDVRSTVPEPHQYGTRYGTGTEENFNDTCTVRTYVRIYTNIQITQRRWCECP